MRCVCRHYESQHTPPPCTDGCWFCPCKEFKPGTNAKSATNVDVEAIREARQERADRKAARLRGWAESAERKAAAINRNIPDDMSFWTQPGMLNIKGKYRDRMDKATRLEIHAADLRRRADAIESGVRVAGDAEAKRQKIRDAHDTLISVGTRVRDFCFGEGEVVKVNTKSYRIRFDSGGTYARDKSFVKPL